MTILVAALDFALLLAVLRLTAWPLLVSAGVAAAGTAPVGLRKPTRLDGGPHRQEPASDEGVALADVGGVDGSSDEIEAAIAARKRALTLRGCPSCGTECGQTDAFCRGCGTQLAKEVS